MKASTVNTQDGTVEINASYYNALTAAVRGVITARNKSDEDGGDTDGIFDAIAELDSAYADGKNPARPRGAVLAAEDWEEIYYALDYKLTSPAVGNTVKLWEMLSSARRPGPMNSHTTPSRIARTITTVGTTNGKPAGRC